MQLEQHWNQRPHGANRSTPILPNPSLTAIVKNDIAPPSSPAISADSTLDMPQNIFRANPSLPVMPNHIPHHRSQPQLSRGSQNVRPPRAMRGTEIAHPLAENIFQRRVAIGQL